MLPPTLRITDVIQTVSLTDAEAKNLVIALIIPGNSTNLQEKKRNKIAAWKTNNDPSSLCEDGNLGILIGFLFQFEEELKPAVKMLLMLGPHAACI